MWKAVVLALLCTAATVRAKASLAAALAATVVPSGEPVCFLEAVGSATSVDMVCPLGTTEDDNNPYCYKPCSVFNGVGGAGVTYVTSTQNDDHCLPVCPSSATAAKLSSTTTSVTCITCPTGYVAVPLKGCFSACSPTGTYPVDIRSGVARPVCGKKCGGSYPLDSKDNALKCANAAGATQTRPTVARTTIAAKTTTKLSQLPKTEVDMQCPPGATEFAMYWDDNNPQEPHIQCYTCPAGQTPGNYNNQWAYCQNAACPTADYSRCGNFCFSSAYAAVLNATGTLSEADCVTFWQSFDCIGNCFKEEETTPSGAKAAAAVATAAPLHSLRAPKKPWEV